MSLRHVKAGRAGRGDCKRRSLAHYQRMQKIAYNKNHIPIETRFWSKVKKGRPDECWPWLGCCAQGYGRFNVNGKSDVAARVAWRFHNGEIPDRLKILHSCDNPPCCNPNHLFIGTSKDNTQDMYRKGRDNHVKGERCWSAKVTENAVREIRASTEHWKVFSDKYGIAQDAIQKIRGRRTWKHVV